MKYVIRKNNQGEIKPNFDGNTLSHTLKRDYEYIYDSMKANKYNIDFENYGILVELVSDEKVVGFAAFFIPQASAMSLTETYVLPEFESQNLLMDSFLMIMASGNTISMLKATRDIVEQLINGYVNN